MAYCRWSSDNGKSNVYVHAMNGGIIISLATSDNNFLTWKHPEAGKEYFLPGALEAVSKLKELRQLGVWVPSKAIWRLEFEAGLLA